MKQKKTRKASTKRKRRNYEQIRSNNKALCQLLNDNNKKDDKCSVAYSV